MAGGWSRWQRALAGAAMALCAGACGAQTAYRCKSHGEVTYSQLPCPGGRIVGRHAARDTDKWKVPPQDRAVRARRAELPAADRQECSVLDGRLREQQHALDKRGAAATLQDEMPLVQTKKKFRELRC